MRNYRVWVRDEYRGLMKAENRNVAYEVARQWSGCPEVPVQVTVEEARIPSVLSPLDCELKKLIGRNQ